MPTVLSLAIVLCGIAAALNWRHGFYACIVAALVQDPLRKLIPGEPVYLTLAAAFVLALAVVNALSRGISLSPRQIEGWRHLSTPFLILIVWILIQTLHSLIAYGNPLSTTIGLATYLAPMCVPIISYNFALRSGPNGVQNWLRFYSGFTGLILTTVVLEYAGVQSDLFGQVGEGMKIYDVGTILIGKTGTFRSTEVAAWHAMAATCFAFIALTSSKMNNKRLALAITVAMIMIAIAVLTGRRKSIIAVATFATTYLFLFSIFHKDFQNWLIGLIAIGATLFLIVSVIFDSKIDDRSAHTAEYLLFLERSKSVFEEAPDRLVQMSLGQAEWATRTTGLLGAGIGVATSGARHVGTMARQFGGVGEGGAGKVLAELGVPGLILIGWFMLSLLRHVWHILRFAARRSTPIFRLSAGLVAFLVANGTIFIVNTQIFSDFFVLIVFGLTVGYLLAMPVLAERSATTTPTTAGPGAVRATVRP